MADVTLTRKPRVSRRPGRAREVIGVRQFSLRTVAAYVFLGALTIYFLTPLYWLAIAATKNNTDLFSSFGLWFAHFNLFQNLADVFTFQNGIYLRWILNTAIYAVVGGFFATVVSVMAGYALAKYRFPGRNLISALVLGAVLVPATTLALPTYLLMSKIHMTDTYWALLLPSLLNPIGVFLATIYSRASVPDDLMDAARADGAGELRVFLQIAAPLLVPGMVTIFLFQFVMIWNNFFLPLVVLSDPNLYPVSLGLVTWNFDPASHQLLFNLIVTGSFLAVLPLIALFLFLQRYWRAGLSFGGMAG